MALRGLNRGKIMEYQKKGIENITKLDSNFAPTLVYHLLPDMNFNGQCLIKNNISIPKKSNKSIYFLHTRSSVKKFKQILH